MKQCSSCIPIATLSWLQRFGNQPSYSPSYGEKVFTISRIVVPLSSLF